MSESNLSPAASLRSLRHHDASWLGAIGLALLFAISLIAYPPLTDASTALETPKWVKFLGRFHVVALHLPVGVIVLAAIMELFISIKHKSTTYLAPAQNFTLMIGAWGAVIAVIFGSFLARSGHNNNNAVFYAHQALGIACAIGIILTLMLRLVMEAAPRFALLYRVVFALTLTSLSLGAHFGGNMVHGSDYLIKDAPEFVAKIMTSIERDILARFEPVKVQPGKTNPPPVTGNPEQVTSTTSPTVYAALIAPILEAKCYSCHGPEKSKGDLRLDSHERILKGGKNGETLVVGQPEKSLMITSMQLPLEDDDHMPPPKKPQPSKEEIALLCWWIKEGASKDVKIIDARFPEELKPLVAKLVADVKGGSSGSTPPIIIGMQQVAATAGTHSLDPNAVVFKDIIQPILAAKCNACHGKEKAKGKLRMHTFADLMKGGSDGATTVVSNKPDDSLMLKRVNLPVDDDDHMPPKDEKQPTKEEIAILKWWIENGASETVTFSASKNTPEIESFINKVAAASPVTAPDSEKIEEMPKAKPFTPAEKKAVEEVTARISALNASLQPLAQDTTQLRFSCINAADKFGDKELAELEPVAAHITWMDLGRSKVTDTGFAIIGKMTNLERLHLEHTAITDAGLSQIASLQHLHYLNLYGTKVTDAGIAKLSGIKQLKKLFVWQTAVTAVGAKKLEQAVPGLVVNTGL